MKKLIPFLIFFFLGLQANCQNTGYLGKHVILKTDFLNGKRKGFNNLDLELVTARTTSFTASFRTFAFAGTSQARETELDKTVEFPVYHPGTYYPEINYTTEGYYSDEDFEVFKAVFPGQTKGWLATVGVKKYFNRILPAPQGWYTSFEMGYGAAELTYTYETRYEPRLSSGRYGLPFSEGKKQIITECNLFYYTLPSLGYQAILLNRLVLDLKFQFEGTKNNIPQDFLKEYPYPYFSTNTGSARLGQVTFGPAIYGKFGVLLF